MPLSNAERQKRFRGRIKQKAAEQSAFELFLSARLAWLAAALEVARDDNDADLIGVLEEVIVGTTASTTNREHVTAVLTAAVEQDVSDEVRSALKARCRKKVRRRSSGAS